MRLDQFNYTFHLTECSDNVIVAQSIEEVFLDVVNITINEQVSFLKKVLKRNDDGNIIISLNVEYNNKLYENVEFLVYLADSLNTEAAVFVDKYQLSSGIFVEHKDASREQDVIVEDFEQIEEHLDTPIFIEDGPVIDINNYKENAATTKESIIREFFETIEKNLSKKIEKSFDSLHQQSLVSVEELKQSSVEQLTERVTTLATNVQNSISDWKSNIETRISSAVAQQLHQAENAIKETFEEVVQEQQETTIDYVVERLTAVNINFKEAVEARVAQIINEAKLSIDKTSLANNAALKQYVTEQLDDVQKTFAKKHEIIYEKGLKDFVSKQSLWVEDYVKQHLNNIDASIISQATQRVVATIEEKQAQQLDAVRTGIFDVIKEQLDALQEEATTITEARDSAKSLFTNFSLTIKSDVAKDVDSKLSVLKTEIGRQIARYVESYGGGGGSVAVQYANGGTINGTLDVRAPILSGGVDLFNIFATSTSSSGFQTLAFDESTALLTIEPNGNTISLSALSGGNSSGGGPGIDTGVRALTSNWESTYTTVLTNSGAWNYQGTDVKALTANWQNTYTTVLANSASWGNGGSSTDTGVRALTSNWENTYSTVLSNSAQWATDVSIDTGVRSLTSNWENTYSTVLTNSAMWDNGGSSTDTGVRALTSNWESTYSTVLTNSAVWGNGGSSTDVGVRALTANWENTYSTVLSNSAHWATDVSIDTGVRALTSNWENTYSTVFANSAQWSIDTNTDTGVRALTSNWENTYSTVLANSAQWSAIPDTNFLPLTGGTLTGIVSTTSDIEITDFNYGIILRSPNNSRFRITVSNTGALISTLL